jgi:hypothetical protein
MIDGMGMNAKQALMILDQATSQLNVNRQTHNQILEALKTIQALVLAQEQNQSLGKKVPLENAT